MRYGRYSRYGGLTYPSNSGTLGSHPQSGPNPAASASDATWVCRSCHLRLADQRRENKEDDLAKQDVMAFFEKAMKDDALRAQLVGLSAKYHETKVIDELIDLAAKAGFVFSVGDYAEARSERQTTISEKKPPVLQVWRE